MGFSFSLEMSRSWCLLQLHAVSGTMASYWWHRRSIVIVTVIVIVIVMLPWSRCNTLPLDLLNFMRFYWAHCPSLSRSLWVSFHPTYVLTALCSLVSSTHFLMLRSISTVHVINEDIKKTCSYTEPWGAPLVTDFHLDLEFFIQNTVKSTLNPYISNLERRILWRTTSKALLKFR